MMSKHWEKVLIVASILFGLSTASSRDVARRRGFTPQAMTEMRARSLMERATHASDLLYYTNQTKGESSDSTGRPCHVDSTCLRWAPPEYFVESLPDIPQSFMTELYSGVIPLDMSNASRGMFFAFQPRVGPPVKEITIWFNGGPGQSSTGVNSRCT